MQSLEGIGRPQQPIGGTMGSGPTAQEDRRVAGSVWQDTAD